MLAFSHQICGDPSSASRFPWFAAAGASFSSGMLEGQEADNTEATRSRDVFSGAADDAERLLPRTHNTRAEAIPADRHFVIIPRVSASGDKGMHDHLATRRVESISFLHDWERCRSA